MTYYTSWITDQELIQILQQDETEHKKTIQILKGGIQNEHPKNEIKSSTI